MEAPGWESSSATKWLAVFYIPLGPLGRYRLKVLTDFGRERTRVRATPVGVLVSQENRFDIVERTALSWSEILKTYAKTFVGLPILMVGPYLVLLGVTALLPLIPGLQIPKGAMPQWVSTLLLVGSIMSLGNFLWWPIWAIRKSRGMQPNSMPKRKKGAAIIDRASVEHHL